MVLRERGQFKPGFGPSGTLAVICDAYPYVNALP